MKALEVIWDLPVQALQTNDSVAFTQDQKRRSAKTRKLQLPCQGQRENNLKA